MIKVNCFCIDLGNFIIVQGFQNHMGDGQSPLHADSEAALFWARSWSGHNKPFPSLAPCLPLLFRVLYTDDRNIYTVELETFIKEYQTNFRPTVHLLLCFNPFGISWYLVKLFLKHHVGLLVVVLSSAHKLFSLTLAAAFSWPASPHNPSAWSLGDPALSCLEGTHRAKR